MKLGVMQPYFFPYAQQFRHIGKCDRWIIFDTPKFSRKSYVTRNRILNQNTGWSYIKASVEKSASLSSISCAVLSRNDWRDDLRNALCIYRNRAPFYDFVLEAVEHCIAPDHRTIADLNIYALKYISKLLHIDTKIEVLSEMNLDLPQTLPAGEWALEISRQTAAKIYSNAPGGKLLFDSELYRAHGIELEYYDPVPLLYSTPGFAFEQNLSIIDTLMWLGPAGVTKWCKS